MSNLLINTHVATLLPSRRKHLKRLGAVLASNTVPFIRAPRRAFASDYLAPPLKRSEIAAIFAIAEEFLRRFNAPGLSVAISRHGQLVYQNGFGYADPATQEPLTSEHLFRIASVSKTITATSVFTLIEQGKLGLHDLVFGPKGLLSSDFAFKDIRYLNDITVYHLLTHTCGGWGNKNDDSMFEKTDLNHRQLIAATIRTKPLTMVSGTHFNYSNFGYCLLGRIIEKQSGQSYSEFVKKNVLLKCGITGLQLSGNTLFDRAEGEVIYSGQNGDKPYAMNLRRMDSHGGWLGTPTDLVQFAMHVDGFNTTPNILSSQTIKQMTSPSRVNASYACGWSVNSMPNWWHSGSLPGSTSLLVRTASGLCWAALVNTRITGIDLALDEMMWRIVRTIKAWKA